MLIVVSDLHFVDGTAGEHNLPFDAFKDVFLDDVEALARDKGAKEIKLVLLGDIVDLIRSEQWFSRGGRSFPLAKRPWGRQGVADAKNWDRPPSGTDTERRCLDILGRLPSGNKKPAKPQSTILSKNWDTFQLIRHLPNELRRRLRRNKLPVEVIYVPGNHDRLVNLYPAVRDELARILGLKMSPQTTWTDEKGNRRFRTDFVDEDYWVYARHGHQYDPWNYGGGNDHSIGAQLQPAIGDVFATEFAVRIPWQLEQMRRTNKAITQGLIRNLKDMDNVRPPSHVMEWFYYRIGAEDHGPVRRALEKAFDKVAINLLQIPFVQQWRSPATHADEYIRAASSRWLRWISSRLIDALEAEDLLPLLLKGAGGKGDPEKDQYAQAAYHERIWRNGEKDIRFIVYGHTHTPMQMPLDGDDEREVVYINTGTWRERIRRTIGLDKAPNFIKSKQMTYAVFYNRDEDTDRKRRGTVSFDIWTGSRKKYYR